LCCLSSQQQQQQEVDDEISNQFETTATTPTHRTINEEANDCDHDYNNQQYSRIRKGEIYVRDNFLTPPEIAGLRKDIARLHKDGCFKPSGLSNRVEGDANNFGSSDRLTCTIHTNVNSNANTNTVTPDQRLSSNAHFAVEEKMECLKPILQSSLSPLITRRKHQQQQQPNGLKLELAEMYYSISPGGSHLPKHQDERHEDTKGGKGWINETRRSISWLIYLNNEHWGDATASATANTKHQNASTTTTTTTKDVDDDAAATIHNSNYNGNDDETTTGLGGELRAYCRICCPEEHVQCGSHEGNLQVGWLRSRKSKSTTTTDDESKIEFEPVFLDAWVKTKAPTTTSIIDESNDDYYSSQLEWQPMSALYRLERSTSLLLLQDNKNNHYCSQDDDGDNLDDDGGGDNDKPPLLPRRDYISEPFGPNSPSWPSNHDLEPFEFAKALASQLTKKDHRSRFVGTEEIETRQQQQRQQQQHGDSADDESSSSSETVSIVDVVPKGGRLVLFDSVTVPHEVLEVTQGTRLAIAGWFHEPQQEFPDWYGT